MTDVSDKEFILKILDNKSKIVLAELQSESYATKNWRPHLMYLIMLVMFYDFIITPLLRSLGLPLEVMPIPNDMWNLLTISVGGYIVGRSGERIADSISQKKLYDNLDVEKLSSIIKNTGK